MHGRVSLFRNHQDFCLVTVYKGAWISFLLFYTHPVCPICALHHKKTEHRCPNPTCPKEDNLRPVADCCSASPSHCANCGDDHPATDPACPARPRRPPNDPAPSDPAPAHPLPEEGDMDTTEDEAEVAETPRPPAPPTVRRLLPAFEVVTPRSARPSAPRPLPALHQALPVRSPRRPPAPLPPRMTVRAWPTNGGPPPSTFPAVDRQGLSFPIHCTTQQPWELGCVPLAHE